jgi:hypothetical protein
MAFDVFLIFYLVAALYIWFDTDAFVEWAGLLRLKFAKTKEFQANKMSSIPLVAAQTYIDFLLYNYGRDSFLIRLITCPVCFSVWCNIILGLVFWCKFNWALLGVNIIATWVGYHVLKWLLKVCNV